MCEESLKNSMFFFRFGKCATVAHTFLTNAETINLSCSPFQFPIPRNQRNPPLA